MWAAALGISDLLPVPLSDPRTEVGAVQPLARSNQEHEAHQIGDVPFDVGLIEHARLAESERVPCGIHDADGNLITHLRKLDEAGYLATKKTGIGTAWAAQVRPPSAVASTTPVRRVPTAQPW